MGSNCEENSRFRVNLISECYVKPSNVCNKPPIHLGVTDLFMLTMDSIQKGLLFNTKLQSNTLKKLEKVLYISLLDFYPLAARLATKKFHEEHACCFYVDCEAGSGARLIHANLDISISDIVSSIDVHPLVESFFDLGDKFVNYDGHTRPLLSIQVTELIDGVFIGFTINHCIADGTSLSHFITSLSEIFGQINDEEIDYAENSEKYRDISISKKPIFETLFPYKGYNKILKFPHLEPDEFVVRNDPGPLRVRIFHFSSKSISILKAKANVECGLDNTISSFQALYAFIWRAITRARNLQPDDNVSGAIVINARTRVDPPLPPDYFRCFVTGSHVVTKGDDLITNGLGRAALSVNESIKNQDGQAFLNQHKQFEEHPVVIHLGPGSPFYMPNNLTVGGSPRFDMYGPEFGLGRAIAVLAGYASRDDGKVTANPGREGGGSVDLEICLKPKTMNALEVDEDFMSYVSTIDHKIKLV